MDTLSFKPISRRPNVPKFVEEDEAWWFDNLPRLFDGSITPTAIDPDKSKENEAACYLHSITGKQIDVRQLLLMYDVIYMEPPLVDVKNEKLSFWIDQSISQDQIIELIQKGRVRLIHTQPEERGDLGFLREAHQANPSAVQGRRKTAAMMIADIVETADEYVFGSPKIAHQLPELISRIAQERQAPLLEISKIFLLPQCMRRGCLQPFLDRGLMGLNQVGESEVFGKILNRIKDKDLSLEASYFGQAMHVAHMLDATYIPHTDDSGYIRSWLEPAKMMGDHLNFYRSFNTRIAATWADNERRKIDKHSILPAIPFVEFKRDVSFNDILEISASASNRFRGRGLISRLSLLPIEEREEQLDALLADYQSLNSKQKRTQKTMLIGDALINIGAYLADWSLFPITPAIVLLNVALEAAKRSPTLDAVISEIEIALDQELNRNTDMSFMSKISRIATISKLQG